MSFLVLHKTVTYLIAGLGIASLTLGGELTLPSILFLGGGYVGSFFAEGRFLSKPSYGRAWTAAVVVVLVAQVLRGLFGEPLLALGMEFAGFLQVSRLFTRRNGRDHEQIAALAFLHLIAATVLSSDIEYGAIYLAFVIVTPWMLALSHLRRQIEERESGAEGHAEDVDRKLASKNLVPGRFLWGTALLTLPLFVGTTILFLAFPRVGVGLLSFGQQMGQHVTGFGSDIELGQFGMIRDDPTVIMRVTPANMPAAPPTDRTFRLRGTSFDRYDGRRWTRTETASHPMPSYEGYFAITAMPQPEVDEPLRISLDHLDETVLFFPEHTVGLWVEGRMVSGGRDRSRELSRSDGLEIRYFDDDELGLVYTAFVAPPTRRRIALLTKDEEDRYLQQPDSTAMEHIGTLAQTVTRSARNDSERATLIERFLRSDGQFRYSLEMPDTRGRDPLEAFLFYEKYGHCEYFATAMVMMLRSLGIVSRNVTGFLGGRLNPYGGYYAIRLGDSHSWVEAYLPGEGWRSFDPTSATRNRMGPESEGVFAEVRALFDALRTRWANDVVGYDLRIQMSGAARILDWLRGGSRPSRFNRDNPNETRSPGERNPAPWKVLVGALCAAGLVFGAWFLLRRRRPPVRHLDSLEARRAVRLYRALERLLRRAGVPRPPSRTPLEHALQLKKQGFPSSAEVLAITQAYLGTRYGRKALEITRLPRRLFHR